MEHNDKPKEVGPRCSSIKDLRLDIVDGKMSEIHGENKAKG